MRALQAKGFMLVVALLLTTILLLMGMGLVGKRSLEYSSIPALANRAQACALAQAGMEDARVKIEKDVFFPPVEGFAQTTFTYTEEVTDPDTGNRVGGYTVSVTVDKKQEPYKLVRIVSVGSAGPDVAAPVARYKIYAEIDVANEDRNNPGNPNPRLYRYINWREGDIDQVNVPPMPL